MPGSQHVPGRASSLPIAPVDQAVDGATDYASTEGEDSAFLLCRKLRSKLAFAQVESSDGEHVSAIDALQVSWRLWTQPLHWALMFLLAGWLLEGVLATGREWRAARTAG